MGFFGKLGSSVRTLCDVQLKDEKGFDADVGLSEAIDQLAVMIGVLVWACVEKGG